MAEEKVAYSIEEAAHVLGFSRSAMYDAVKNGKIPFIKLSKRRTIIPRAALMKWLETANGGTTHASA